jgi:alkanesulfonate monooxygenase SsuD/methylene tetrahydromethanopterin reductase-like flavin-dependent oxidoreductase (luciferase family)
VRYGVTVPPFEDLFQPRTLAAWAKDAENAGWDGFFLWDHVAIWPTPICDPWVALSAIALATERIRIGPLVTPLPRRRPVKLAREAVSIDHLSNGRLILGVGSGGGPWEYDYLGNEPDPKARAAMLEEGLELVTRFWTGEPVLHKGRFYTFRGDLGPGRPEEAPTPVLPRPVQRPRIPIWVAGSWPKKAPFRRAAQWDGLVPRLLGGDFGAYLTPEHTRDIVSYVRQYRASDEPFDIVISGHTASASDSARVRDVEGAGATWWCEDISPWPFGWNWEGPWPVDAMRDRIRGGPPRL